MNNVIINPAYQWHPANVMYQTRHHTRETRIEHNATKATGINSGLNNSEKILVVAIVWVVISIISVLIIKKIKG